MTLLINGEKRQFSESMNLIQLLSELGFSEKPVVVELNQEALSPSEFSKRELSDGDEVEIIAIAAGG